MAYINKGFDLTLEVDDHGKSSQNSTLSTGIALAWTNLRVETRQLFDQKKPLLNRLNGYLESGKLTGILGVSGAGKSTLLNCLSGRHGGKVHPGKVVNLSFAKCLTFSFFQKVKF